MHPYVNTAIKAARAASNIIMRAYARPDLIKASQKAPRDFVTTTDKAAEQSIIYTLQTAYPNHSILAEESGESKQQSLYQWIIDPIDGTKNFIQGFPHFSISIALKHNNQIEHAVIYDPIRDDLFTASKGNGAQKNNRRIRVSQKTRLEDSMIGTEFPFRAIKHINDYNDALLSIYKEYCTIRQSGSAALDLAYVASGQLDGFLSLELAPWDIAAGILLIKESGGMICDVKGSDNYFKNGTIIAGNAKIMKQILKITQPYFKNYS